MAQRAEEYRTRLRADPRAVGWSLFVACAAHLAALYILIPAEVRRESREQTAERFGYRGPTHHERVIRVRLMPDGQGTAGPRALLGELATDVPRHKTGPVVPSEPRASTRRPKDPGAARESEPSDDLLRTLRARHSDLPTVQSEDLVVIRLVKPDYPPVAIEQGLEGRVELMALVNESGEVEDVEVVTSAGAVFDEAATRAVFRCRFEPFRIAGQVQPVYAHFRIRFTLRDG